MDCRTLEPQLLFLAEHPQDKPFDKDITAHLAACESCRNALHKYREVWATMPQLRQNNPDAWFLQKLEQRLDAAPEKSVAQTSPLIKVLRPVMLTALAAAAVFAGFMIGKVVMNDPVLENETSNSAVIAGQYQMGTSQADLIETYYFTEE